MLYTPNPTWQSGPAGGTLVTAAKLNHIEDGIVQAALDATQAITDAEAAAAARPLNDATDVDVVTDPPQVGEGLGWYGEGWAPMAFARAQGFDAAVPSPQAITTAVELETIILLGAPSITGPDFTYDPLTGQLTVVNGGWCMFDGTAVDVDGTWSTSQDAELLIRAGAAELARGSFISALTDQVTISATRYVPSDTVLTFRIITWTDATLTTATALRILKIA